MCPAESVGFENGASSIVRFAGEDKLHPVHFKIISIGDIAVLSFRVGCIVFFFHHYPHLISLFQFDDALLTPQWAIDNIVIAGSPETVAAEILAVREQVGPFGTIVLTGLDWDEPAIWKRSMALMVNEVMPRLRAARFLRAGSRRQAPCRYREHL